MAPEVGTYILVSQFRVSKNQRGGRPFSYRHVLWDLYLKKG